MCGTDGVTYDNICVIQSQAVTRMDYWGDCGSENGCSLDEHCKRVRDTSRCLHNSTNCRHLVQPEDGCCLICVCVCDMRVCDVCVTCVCVRVCTCACVCVMLEDYSTVPQSRGVSDSGSG